MEGKIKVVCKRIRNKGLPVEVSHKKDNDDEQAKHKTDLHSITGPTTAVAIVTVITVVTVVTVVAVVAALSDEEACGRADSDKSRKRGHCIVVRQKLLERSLYIAVQSSATYSRFGNNKARAVASVLSGKHSAHKVRDAAEDGVANEVL